MEIGQWRNPFIEPKDENNKVLENQYESLGAIFDDVYWH